MGPSLKISALLSIIFLLFFLSSPPSTKADFDQTQLVETICKETLNYTNCLEVLESDPRTKTTTHLNDLAKISLQLAISNANDSLTMINQMINSSTEAAIVQVLKQCAFWYEAVVSSLRSALVELKEDAMSANYDIKTAADDADICEYELVLKRVQLPSVSDRNYQVKLYSSIGYVITDKLS